MLPPYLDRVTYGVMTYGVRLDTRTKEESERRFAYRELVKAPMDAELLEEIRACTNKGWALGSGRFQSKMERMTERRAVPLPKGRPKRQGTA